jgi:hypothetical protein
MPAIYAREGTEFVSFIADSNLMLMPRAGEQPVSCMLPK